LGSLTGEATSPASMSGGVTETEGAAIHIYLMRMGIPQTKETRSCSALYVEV